MSGVVTLIRTVRSGLSGLIVFAVVGVQPSHAAGLTAGDIVKNMQPNELVHYVSGMIEGFAYARFRKDSIEAGHKVETGMQCIRDWYLSNPRTMVTISDAFRQHEQHAPSVVLAAMIKKECGE